MLRRKKPPYIGSPETFAFADLADMPRLLVPDDKDVVIFEGIRKADQQGYPGFFREDELLLAHLGINVHVTWHNRYKRRAKAEEVIDIWNTFPTKGLRRDDQLFTATLDISPETLGQLWAEQGPTFNQSQASIDLRQAAQTEHANLFIRELADTLKLVVHTPLGLYAAAPERKFVTQLSFNQFHLYDGESFSGNMPGKFLYAPDEADLSILKGHFFIDDTSGTGGIDATRPLVSV
jgi:hypothetical protein